MTRSIGLREYAGPGEVVVSSATQRRTAGYFRFAEASVRRRQALPKGLGAFRVVAESGARHRLAAATRLTPFAGRQAENAALSCAWAQAQSGEFQVRLLCGEAGIGKSRLVDALVHRVDQSIAFELFNQFRYDCRILRRCKLKALALGQSCRSRFDSTGFLNSSA